MGIGRIHFLGGRGIEKVVLQRTSSKVIWFATSARKSNAHLMCICRLKLLWEAR